MSKKVFVVIMLFGLYILSGCSAPTSSSKKSCDHFWLDASTKKLSCTQSEVTYECAYCSETKIEEQDDDNHKFEYTVLKEATCTELGEQLKTCSVCGLSEKKLSDYKEHDCEYKIVKKADVFTDGEEVGTCSVCKQKVTRTIRAYGTSRYQPHPMKASDFYRSATKSGKEKYQNEWIMLSGTIKTIVKASSSLTGYYLYGERGSGLVCWVDGKYDGKHKVGDKVTISGHVQTLLFDQVELNSCWFDESLREGNTGADVIKLKERLQELGYFSQGASLSDKYNSTTTERVKLFQKVNGLVETGVVDEATSNRLYWNIAKPNPDPK